MRIALRLSLAAAAIALLSTPAAAQSGPFNSAYPWCAGTTIRGSGQSYRCDFRTFEACRQEITGGNRGWCVPNARYAGNVYDDEPPRRRKRRGHY